MVQQEEVKEGEEPGSTRGRTAALIKQAIAELEDESYRNLEKDDRRSVLATIVKRTGVKPQVNRTDSVLKALRERLAELS